MWEKAQTALSKKIRFVHYTHADAAKKILQSNEVWMRKSSCMNDFREVQHGLDCLCVAFNQTAAGKKFREVIDKPFPGISEEIAKHFNGWIPSLQAETYLSCVSEHEDEEDAIGRLSMWRAYGDGEGVALVLNSEPFLGTSDALKAYTSPVAYLDDQGIARELGRIADNIESNLDFITARGRQELINSLFNMFRFAALCTKHPGFKEEQEWRVIYCPSIDKSEYLHREVQTINGVPQPIYKIPLKDIPTKNLIGIQIPSLLNRIIIGPTRFPAAMWEAFRDLLTDAGVQDANKKVFVSNLPLRR